MLRKLLDASESLWKVTASPKSVQRILEKLDADDNFNILAACKTEISASQAARFYAEHEGKFFYPRLQAYMRSGPVIGLALQGDGVIKNWRQLIGPTKVTKTKYLNPNSLRHDYGISDTRNSFHGQSAFHYLSGIPVDISFRRYRFHIYSL